MDPDRYLDRIGVHLGEVESPDRPTLERLQRAHVTTVPFETLSVTGDPYGDREGEGVTLSLPHLYEKLVERERGGFCFELNGLLGWLLADLGFEVTRVAGRVVSSVELPANHHPLLVGLDRDYLVDVGMGTPMLRRPIAIGEGVGPDEAGIEWRIVESDRSDEEYLLRCRGADGEWEDRYVFDTTPRDLSYFEATCDYLATAPESGFTGDPVLALATDDGHVKLSPETFTRVRGEVSEERLVEEAAFRDRLEETFGIGIDAIRK
jgi:N-hydroxyarylamine O-acetyltransferase